MKRIALAFAGVCLASSLCAWDVEHDGIALLTGEHLPCEISGIFKFGDFATLMGNCHFPDMCDWEPRRWRTLDDMPPCVDSADRDFLEKAGFGGYWLHTEEGKAALMALLSRAFAAGNGAKAAFWLSLLTHAVSDESALNHPTLGNYHRYTRFEGVQYPSRKVEVAAKNVFGFRSDGIVMVKARKRLAGRRPFSGTDASFEDALVRFSVDTIRQGAFSAVKEGQVMFAPRPEAEDALADIVAMQVGAILDMAETAWRFRRADMPMPGADVFSKAGEAVRRFVRTLDPLRESVWAGLADASLDPASPKCTVGVVCEPYGSRDDTFMTYSGKVIAAAAARSLRDMGYALRPLSFWRIDEGALPPSSEMPVLLLAKGDAALPAGFADAVRSWTAAGGRLVFVAGGDPDGIAGFDGALLRRADDEVPASSGWHDAGAGDWRKMGVIFGGREYPQMRNANVDGYCKARCLFAVDPSAAGVEPFAEFRCGSERFAVAARRGNAVWLPQYLLMPFLFTGETTADWAAQRLDAFGKRVLAEAMERIAR